MSRKALCLLIMASLAIFPLGVANAKLPVARNRSILTIAWRDDDRIELAIANRSSSSEELTVELGYYSLGKQIVNESYVQVPPMTILVINYPYKEVVDSRLAPRSADTVFISDNSGRQVATAQIIGAHSDTIYYRVDECLLPAGEEALVYIDTPNADMKMDTEIYINVGKTFTLGDHTGKLKIDSLFRGAFDRAKPPSSGIENTDDVYTYSYGWRGLVIKIPTPRLNGVEQLAFSIDKMISTPHGIAGHGLSSPPILVYGPDMRVVEK